MARNKLEIANMALSKLGARKIPSFLESISVGLENEARAVNDVYEQILKEVLSEHPWTFAQRRVALEYVVPDDTSRTIQGRIFTPVTITSATQANPVVITAAGHGLENGERIKIVGVSGMTQLNGNFYRVASKTVDTFEIIDQHTEEDIDGSAFTAYTSGGQVQLASEQNPISISAATAADPVVITSAAHGLSDGDWIKIIGVAGMTTLNDGFYIVADKTADTFELTDTDGDDVDGSAFSAYTYGGIILPCPEMESMEDGIGTVIVYFRPDDMVKPTRKSISGAFIAFEEDKIVSDVEGLKIKYTYLCEETQKYFPKFDDALATRLAAEIAFRITNSVSKASELLKLYREISLPTAVSGDSVQGTPDQIDQDEWINSMELGTFPRTTGETWHPF
jgi:hypothetical protein